MAFKILVPLTFLLSSALSQNTQYKVCTTKVGNCLSLEKDDSRFACEQTQSRVECGLKLARGTADLAVFTEEELILLAQQQPNEHNVVASIQNSQRTDPYAYEAVVVVASNHTGGFEGLRGGNYCHPGFDATDFRWSPRVLRSLEQLVTSTDRCNEAETSGRTFEEISVERLAGFFSAGCRPGAWSANSTIDATLKSRYPALCSLCGLNATCNAYTLDVVQTADPVPPNRHVQALQCMTNNDRATAFVAWQHVREYFTSRSDLLSKYSLLCPDGTLQVLNATTIVNATAPCAIVRQPYPAIVASKSRAAEVLALLRQYWPSGTRPTASSSWQAILYDMLMQGANNRPVFQDTLPTPANYTTVRGLSTLDSTSFCMPARRWCTVSELENTKCSWTRQASYILGLEPPISCQQRSDVFQCLADVRDGNADFISLDSNYGYLARQAFKLSPVKLLQNSRTATNSLSRVTALVREDPTNVNNITRFENLRGKKACFPEFGGIAYVSFLRTAHEVGVISATECDYARAVGEFFDGACAPGAEDASHKLDVGSSFNSTLLCTACRTVTNTSTCAVNSTNVYFNNNGSLACLADKAADVAFVETQNLDVHIRTLGLNASHYRALCRNNQLAATTGVDVDDSCLLALVVDGEVLARRRDVQLNSLSSLLEYLDDFFGYNAGSMHQLINLEIFSSFDSVSDLLFKESAIGFSEPSSSTTHDPANNYFALFKHLEACTGGAGGLANRNGVVFPLISLVVMTVLARWVVQ